MTGQWSDNVGYDFTGRHIVVVGGASGIGAEIVAVLSGAHADIDVYDRVEPQSDGFRDFTRVDVREAGALERAIEETIGRHGPVDGLVYAVGVLDGYAALDESTDELIATVLDINVVGAIRAIRAVAPGMRSDGFGRIVVFGSIAGQVAGAGGLSYTVSKHAITGLVKHLAVELGPFGITVNAVAPGSIQGTNIRTTIAEVATAPVSTTRGLGTMDAEAVSRLYPVGRLGTVAAVAPTVAMLMSAESWFITGTTSLIDGGYVAR
ncbi:MAG: hypothetical protein JWR01_1295 [Subtercola sp.]|nr:hypothetical protein [Subtercola sp.]